MRLPVTETVALPGGRTLAYRSWPGHGKPLVLLHGLLDCSQGWDKFAEKTHRPCIAFDLPGFGSSSLPSRPQLGSYANAIVAGVEALNLDDFTLVGHSLGGMVATAVAEKIPDRVSSLVLLAPAGYGRLPLSEVVMLPGLKQVIRASLPYTLSNKLTSMGVYMAVVANGKTPDRELLERLRSRARTLGPGVEAAGEMIASFGKSPRAFHHRHVAYDGPVLALWGSSDRLVPSGHSKAVTKALPQAHVEIWSGMGHHPQRERPAMLDRFIERGAARAREERRRRHRLARTQAVTVATA